MKLIVKLLILSLIAGCNSEKEEEDDYKAYEGTKKGAIPLYLNDVDASNLIQTIQPGQPTYLGYTYTTNNYRISSQLEVKIHEYQGIEITRPDTSYYLRVIGAIKLVSNDTNSFSIFSTIGEAAFEVINDTVKPIAFKYVYSGNPPVISHQLIKSLAPVNSYYQYNPYRYYFVCPQTITQVTYGWKVATLENFLCYQTTH